MKTTADAKRSRISQELLQSCGGLLQNATPFTSQKLANPHQIILNFRAKNCNFSKVEFLDKNGGFHPLNCFQNRSFKVKKW